MATKSKKKMALTRETVRSLSRAELERAGGGLTIACPTNLCNTNFCSVGCGSIMCNTGYCATDGCYATLGC